MVTGDGLRLRVVVWVAVVAAIVGYPLARWLNTQSGGLPAPSWFSVALLVALIVAVVGAAWPIGRALRGPNRRVVRSARAVRTLLFAQAEALTGGLVVGLYGAQLIVLAPDSGFGSIQNRMLVDGAMVLCGVGMVAAGLWAQAQCRYDGPDDESQGPGPQAAGSGGAVTGRVVDDDDVR